MKKTVIKSIILSILLISAMNMVLTDTALAETAPSVTGTNTAVFTVLRYGMRGTAVTALQNELKTLGYFNYTATGYYGVLTRNAVAAFQRDNSLIPDGIAGNATQREILAEKIIHKAKSYLGVPYVWGGVSPGGFDCSGFVHYVLLKNNIIIPRVSDQQYKSGTWVGRNFLKQGDLVFFSTYKPGPSHIGIYLGGGQFIHASSVAGKIVISSLNNSYYSSRYIGAKRVIP